MTGGAAPAAAQTLTGRVTALGSGAPVRGAFVVLRDSLAQRVAAAFTDPSGHYVLRAPAPGTWRLGASQLGFSEDSRTISLAAGAAEVVDLTLAEQPIRLEGLSVQGTSRCAGAPLAAAEMWEAARSVLERAAWSAEHAAALFEVRRFSRELDAATGDVVRHHEATAAARVRGSPWRGAPAEELVRDGFVRVRPDGARAWFGPDAEVILSVAFQQTHCFGVDESRADRIGLTFHPVDPGRRNDVRGTLWLDRSAGTLEELTFTYVAPPLGGEVGEAGGRVRFAHLPSGPVVLTGWSTRIPILPRYYRDRPHERRPGRDLVPVEDGAEVLRVLDGAGEVLWEEGGIVDGGPRISAAPRTAGANATAHSVAGLAASECAPRRRGLEETRDVVGVVLDAGGRPLRDAAVEAVWVTSGGTQAQASALTRADGTWALCEMPRDRPYRLRASLPGREDAETLLETGAGDLVFWEARLPAGG